MQLYRINQEIEALIDDETGEVFDMDALIQLLGAKEDKIRNIMMLIKNTRADVAVLETEKKQFESRIKMKKNLVERLTNYLAMNTEGQTFDFPEGAIRYRASEETEIDDAFIDWAMNSPEGERFLTYSIPKANKTAIKSYIKAGNDVPHARLVKKNNIQIK